MEKNLQRLVIEEEISHQDFKEHRSQIEAQRSRLTNTVALQLATQLDFLFDKDNYNEKRLLCETVFKRLYVERGRITKTELNAPFALITRRTGGSGVVTSGGPNWTIQRTFSLAFNLAT